MKCGSSGHLIPLRSRVMFPVMIAGRVLYGATQSSRFRAEANLSTDRFEDQAGN